MGTNAFYLLLVVAVVRLQCRRLSVIIAGHCARHQFSQVQILYGDHLILMSVRSSKLRWWIDPMGVIILSVLISVLWL